MSDPVVIIETIHILLDETIITIAAMDLIPKIKNMMEVVEEAILVAMKQIKNMTVGVEAMKRETIAIPMTANLITRQIIVVAFINLVIMDLKNTSRLDLLNLYLL